MQVDAPCDGVLRVLAPNPGPLTGPGTNTYVVGRREVVVIDPGPDLAEHLDSLLAAIGGRPVRAILVTHAHLDHTGLAPALSSQTGAPVLAAGRATDGRRREMEALAASGLAGGGEGLDTQFTPDRRIGSEYVLMIEGKQIEPVPTPGHLPTHLAFAFGDVIFTGDQVMGWSTTVVSPPDGDMAAYMESLALLAERSARLFLPGHGDPVTDPAGRVATLIAHRRSREAAILDRLSSRPQTAQEIAAAIYTDTPPGLLPAAARNVLAHLIDLQSRNLACTDGPMRADAGFRRPEN